MPFWIFKKKEEAWEEPAIVLKADTSKPQKIDSALQDVADSFYEIHKTLIKAEHNAAASGDILDRVDRYSALINQAIETLRKEDSELVGYWFSIRDLKDELVSGIKSIIHSSAYAMPLHDDKVFDLGKLSRNQISHFTQLLSDVKKKLYVSYHKYDFTARWPERIGFGK